MRVEGFQEKCKELAEDKNARCIYLQLLAPNCSRYLQPELAEVVNPACGDVPSDTTANPPQASNDGTTVEVFLHICGP